MENNNRSNTFKKNKEVEILLRQLAEHMSPIEEKLTAESESSSYPPIFIYGCARSGTTLLHQYLINNVKSIYPSNFISRFFYAPYIGGIFYKLFTELDNKGELLGNTGKGTGKFYASDLGKTKGILSPNEFWYFWRKHFPINDRRTIDIDAIKEPEALKFRNSIYAIQNLFEAPFITKGLIANNCIDYLSVLFPTAIFFYVKRDLYSNAKSLYQARLNFFDAADKWYSFYPKDPNYYKNLTAEEQVVRQVIDTNQEIESSLKKIDKDRIITLNYEAFCRNPGVILHELQNVNGSITINNKPEPSEFNPSENNNDDNHSNKVIKTVIENL
jgi:Sulfotransferase family